MEETSSGKCYMADSVQIKSDRTLYRRRSMHLKGHDYAQAGAYFITICTDKRQAFLDSEGTRRMVRCWWAKLSEKFEGVQADEFVILPNHIHGIIIIVGADPCVCPDKPVFHKGERAGSPLHRIVQWFKTMTTNNYIKDVKQCGREQFHGKLWQRNYYEHIIRDEDELSRIREYIINNPLNWQYDRENPNSIQNKEYDNNWGLFEESIYGKRKGAFSTNSFPKL